MFVILPDSVAVYSTTTGQRLWEAKIEKDHLLHKITFSEEILGSEPVPFITKDITGYLVKAIEGLHEEAAITIYDTKTGKLLGSTKVPLEEAREIEFGTMVAKGPSICYTIGQSVYVSKIEGKLFRKHKFSLADKCFVGSKTTKINRRWRIELLGFVSKSNILIGNLYGDDEIKLFCLDLDIACVAKSERNGQDFCMVPSSYQSLGSPGNVFKPVYRTDRDTGAVELVGIMRRYNSSSDFIKIDNGLFVTEMQCPSSL